MPRDVKHREFLRFVSKITDAAATYSKEELVEFERIARRDFPWLREIVHAYIALVHRADSEVPRPMKLRETRSRKSERFDPRNMHLFDLLRSKKLFASNNYLAEFATKILPGMSSRRFDKMSRGDIAARIVEYLETLDRRTRDRMEDAIRVAALGASQSGKTDKESFFNRWESIIKGMDL